MPDPVRILWTHRAERDLLNIIGFIGLENPSAANKPAQKIKASTEILAHYPLLYRASARLPGCREIVVHPNYILVYRLSGKSVQILRIVHARAHYRKTTL